MHLCGALNILVLLRAPAIVQRGHSALQVWGISEWDDQDTVVEDEDKAAFSAHVSTMFADIL